MISKIDVDVPGGGINSPETMPKLLIAGSQANSQDEFADSPYLLLMGALRRKWKIGLPIGLLAGVAMGIVGWQMFQATYSASSYLRVSADDTPLIFETADQAATRATTFGLYKNTQSQLIKTPFVINAALRNETEPLVPELLGQQSPTNWIMENLKVSFPGGGEIMQVSLESKSAEGCLKLLNAIVDAYMNEVVMSERNARLKRLDNLERAHSEAENKIRSKRVELKNLASALGTSDSESLTVAQQTAIQQFGVVQEKLSEVQFQLMQSEGELEVATEQFSVGDKDPKEPQGQESAPERKKPLAVEFAKPGDLLELEARVSDLTYKLDALNVGSGHPSHRRMTAELQNLRAMAERRTRDWSIERESAGFVVSTGQDLQSLKLRIAALKKQESRLLQNVNELQQETRELGKSSIDVELMRSEIESHEEVLARVGGEIERTAIELKTDTRVQLISAAESPIAPSPVKKVSKVFLLAGIGFGLPMFFLVIWDLRSKKLSTFGLVNKKLSLSPLGAIPEVRDDPVRSVLHNSAIGDFRRLGELEESVDGIAAMLMHRALLEDRRVITISSAISTEGKSTIASQVAISLARSGKKIALVDFDLRRPSLHRYLDLDLGPGVKEILGETQDWASAVQQPKAIENLSVITCGKVETHVAERNGCGALQDFLDQLRSSFDLVILDSSPIVPVVDTRIVAKLTDGVVMAMRRDVSTLPLVTAACDILKAHGVSLIGSVIVGCGNSGLYSGYYGHDHYYAVSGRNANTPTKYRGVAEVN